MKSQGQEFLPSEDRMAGFSTTADSRNNVTLLKWGKPVAWFSAMLEKAIKVFIESVKTCEEAECKNQANGGGGWFALRHY